MDYIINPWVFFWIGVIHATDMVNSMVFILLTMACMFFFVSYLDEKSGICRNEHEAERYLKSLKKLIPFLVATFIGVIFLPSEKTMYQMLVAHYATKQNVTLTVETIDKITDNLINKVKNSK